jgi:outer membrane protein OmpA-like peptidoglycan-associated protein
VIFTPNGGTGAMLPQSENVRTALTLNSYTRVGFRFAGWNTAANGSGTSYANGATYGFTAGVTLYAQWSTGAKFVVTYKANGGSGTMAPESKRTQGTLTLNQFTRPQHRFFKWTTAANGSGSSYANGATYLFTKSMTLYAQWHIIKKPVVLPAVDAVATLSPFAANSSTLSSALESQISALARDIKANRDTKIALVGYSGKLAAVNKLNEAAWAANLKISGERAVHVEAYLKQQLSALGVKKYSITAVGTGDSNPPGAIATVVSEAKNRCVVATIT